MLRLTAVTLAVLALGAGGAAAKDYSDATYNFRVTLPADWGTVVPAQPDPYIRVVLKSPRIILTHGNCNVITQEMPTTLALSQADLEAQMDAAIDEAFWLKGMKQAQYVTNASIEGTGAKMRNGHKSYFVVSNLEATLPDIGAIKAKSQQMIEAIPGQLFIVTCTASDTGYATEETDFNIVFDSFAPISDTPVASAEPPGVSSLTLYSQARFGGVSHVVTQDTPDFAAHGWRNAAASLSIAGNAPWQVCDGANYTGSCRVVSGVMPASGLATPVLSARHHTAQRGDLAQALAAHSADALRASLAPR